jgi:SAM-dependent methyltransferase
MDADPDDATWRYDWPAGGRLLAELDVLCDPRGLTVIDLGCGSGRLGAWARGRGAARVLFADLSPTALAAVAARHPGAETLLHRWGDPLPTADLVLGGDILYRPALFPALIVSLASALRSGGQALFADPRSSLEKELPELCRDAGLSWTCERRPGDYTLARILAGG